MVPKLYDKVILKTGETAHIVEIYESGVAYEADIDKDVGEYIETVTETIKQDDIERIVA